MFRSEPKRPERILIYQIGSLGDTLVSVPCYKAIRRHFGKSALITLLHNIPADVRAVPQQVLMDSGIVDEFVGFRQTNTSRIHDPLGLWKKIVLLQSDVVIYLAPAERGKLAVRRDRLFFHLCGIRRTIGFHAYDAELFRTHHSSGGRKSVPHEAALRIDRLKRDGIDGEVNAENARLTVPEHALDTVRNILSALHLSPGKHLIAIAPGANQPANYWPLDRFEAIGQRLLKTGRYELVIIGGTREQEAAKWLSSSWKTGIQMAGQLSVLESAALISCCRLLIGLDTGTTHLAAAVGTPSIAIYGDRNSLGQWLPIGPDHIVLRQEVACGGCRLKECNQPGHPCMTGITVDDVWQAVEQTIYVGERTSNEAASLQL